MSQVYRFGAAMLFAGAIGFLLGRVGRHAPPASVVTQPAPPAPSPKADIVNQALQDLVARLNARLRTVTARSRQLLSDSVAYADSVRVLREKQHRDSAALATVSRDTTVPRDTVAARCSVVQMDCEARATLAEHRVTDLQRQLVDLLRVGAHPCGLQVTVGPQIRPPLKISPVGLTVGLGCPVAWPF